jgi:hypothetical protein
VYPGGGVRYAHGGRPASRWTGCVPIVVSTMPSGVWPATEGSIFMVTGILRPFSVYLGNWRCTVESSASQLSSSMASISVTTGG